MDLSEAQEKTLKLLTEAGDKAELLSIMSEMDADDYFESMGILDDEAIHEYVTFHSEEIVKTSILLNFGARSIDVRQLMGTAMLYGISVGYQMALIREDRPE